MPSNKVELLCENCGSRLLYQARHDNRYRCWVCHELLPLPKDPRQVKPDPTEREAQKL